MAGIQEQQKREGELAIHSKGCPNKTKTPLSDIRSLT